MSKTDYLILGQGLAGSLLAYQLIKKGASVHVVDNLSDKSASRVAAGMFNPVVFKRLNLSWNAHEFLPIALDFYKSIEEDLGVKFCHQIPLARFFNDQYGANQFEVEADLKLKDHLDVSRDEHLDAYPNKYGYGIVKTAGYVDMNVLLDAVNAWLVANNSFSEMNVREEDCSWTTDGVTLKGIEAKHLVCANGTGIEGWSCWDFIPIIGTKGQVLTLTGESNTQNYILNNGKFLLPIGDGVFRAGSTYEWNAASEEPDEKGKQEICDKLKDLLPRNVQITEHRAGIRPATRDRRPVLGTHPDNKHLHLFNGLGTRGVIIAPALSKMMADYLIDGAAIDQEASISRLKK